MPKRWPKPALQRIETGMPVVSPSDAAAIKEIVKRNLGPQIFAFARCMVDDVKRAVDSGVSGVVMEVPSSTHILESAYKWPLEKAIDLSIESTAYAHSQGLEVVFFPIDFSRAEIKWVLDLITRVANGRPHGCPGAGGYVRRVWVPVPFSIWCVRLRTVSTSGWKLTSIWTSAWAVANTVMAVAEGVEVIHSTVLGIGERAGNAPHGRDRHGAADPLRIDTGLKYNKLFSLAKLVEKLSGHRVPKNRPVVGEQLFEIESGIIASWWQNCGQDNPPSSSPSVRNSSAIQRRRW